MTRVNIDGPDRDQLLKKYALPYTGKQLCTGATCAVALATIAAGDIVIAQQEASATANYIQYITITAGTGFVVTVNTSPGTSSINWAVFAANA